jgi:hypothetical protein
MELFGGWPSGSSGSPIVVKAEGHTDSTTRGVTAGTDSVIWQAASGNGALSWGVPNGVHHWRFKGIVFDGADYDQFGGSYITFNNNANNIEFRNNLFKNHARNKIGTVGDAVIGVLLSQASGTHPFIHNNRFHFNRFDYETAADGDGPSHFLYFQNDGNIVEFNDFTTQTPNHPKLAIQLFAKNTNTINDNVIRFNRFFGFGNTGSSSTVLMSARCNRNKVYGNEFFDCDRRAMDFRAGSGVVGTAADNVFAYNTIVNCSDGVYFATANNDEDFLRTIIKDNIAFDCDTAYTPGGTDTDASNNSFDGTDPEFTDPDNDDYSLSASTPSGITEGGTPLGSPYEDADFVGITRDPTSPSIGAHQFGELDPPEPPINVISSPAGFSTTKDTPVTTPVSVTDNNDPDLLAEVWLQADGNGTWDVDVSGGATSVENP